MSVNEVYVRVCKEGWKNATSKNLKIIFSSVENASSLLRNVVLS